MSRTPHPAAVPTVALVSGSFGAGHDAAAAAIAAQLEQHGVRTRTWDVVDLFPGRFGRALRSGYLRQIRTAPGSWRRLLDRLERDDGAARLVTRVLATASDPVLRAVGDASAVVSTHPFASQVLGSLRAHDRLTAPVTTYLTDMSVHRLWVHPGVDAHLAVHDLPALEACARGARGVETVTPAVASAFTAVDRGPAARARACDRFGIPVGRPVALVTGGSYGVGELWESARDLARTGLVTPVVLCGTNRRLLARVRRDAGLVGLGWVDAMPTLLSAADVVVQNAGGSTSLEALAAGVPVLTYRSIPGHGETNAAELAAAGLAPWVRSAADLGDALREAMAAGVAPHGMVRPPEVADVLLGTSALVA